MRGRRRDRQFLLPNDAEPELWALSPKFERTCVSPTNDPKGGARAWLVWSLAAAAFGYAFFQRVAPGAMVDDLMREFAIGGAVLGTLSALYFYPYVLLQVPLGALLDQIGARLLLTCALGTAALGSVIFGISESLTLAYLGRILIGIGSAVGFLGSLAIAGRWFAPERFTFLAGLAMFVAMLSGMVGGTPLALMVGEHGWRASMVVSGVIGGAIAVLIFLLVRDSPEGPIASNRSASSVWRDVGQGLWRTARLWRVWRTALIAGAMSGPMLTIAGLWGTPYLMTAYGLGRAEAAGLVSLLLLGWAVGAPFWGWLSDRTGNRIGLLRGAAAGLTFSLALVCFVPILPLWLTVAAFVATGLLGAAMPICFAHARHVAPDDISGSVTGVVNSFTVLAGAILQPVVGLVLDMRWDGAMLDAARVYDPADYRVGFMFIFGSAFAGLILSLTLHESYSPQGEVSR